MQPMNVKHYPCLPTSSAYAFPIPSVAPVTTGSWTKKVKQVELAFFPLIWHTYNEKGSQWYGC